MTEIEKLIEFLEPLKPGPIKDQPNNNPYKPGTVLERLVFECWDEFEGGNSEKMVSYKVLHRMEKPVWNPPILSFTMERHGATVGGSIWADIQEWKLNIQTLKADCETIGRRQVEAMDRRLNVGPITEEIAHLIQTHETDERLKWNKDGSVRIRMGKIIPMTKAQTTTGRRKRFRKALTESLANTGWQEIRTNVYLKKGGEDSFLPIG
jgi:hypothetical protein